MAKVLTIVVLEFMGSNPAAPLVVPLVCTGPDCAHAVLCDHHPPQHPMAIQHPQVPGFPQRNHRCVMAPKVVGTAVYMSVLLMTPPSAAQRFRDPFETLCCFRTNYTNALDLPVVCNRANKTAQNSPRALRASSPAVTVRSVNTYAA